MELIRRQTLRELKLIIRKSELDNSMVFLCYTGRCSLVHERGLRNVVVGCSTTDEASCERVPPRLDKCEIFTPLENFLIHCQGVTTNVTVVRF